MLRNHVYDWNCSVKSIVTFIIRCHKTNTLTVHAQFRVTLFDNFNDISTFTTTQYLMWRMQCVIYISNKSQYLKNEERYACKITASVYSWTSKPVRRWFIIINRQWFEKWHLPKIAFALETVFAPVFCTSQIFLCGSNITHNLWRSVINEKTK